MTGTAAPWVRAQFFDNNGLVAAGYKLFTYAAGSTTKQTTWTDATLGTPNTNPVVLDSSGRAGVFLGGLSYKFVLAPPNDTDPPTSPIWTVDNVISIPQTTGNTNLPANFGATVTANQVVFLSDGSGGNIAGSWYVADPANAFSSTTAPLVGFALTAQTAGTSGTVLVIGQVTGLSSLTPGVSYYIGTSGTLTSTPPANARLILIADSTTTGDIFVPATPPNASATVAGLVSTGPQTWAGAKTLQGALTVQNTIVATGNLTTNANLSYAPGGSSTQIFPNGVISLQTSIAGVNNVTTTETTLFTFSLPASVLNAVGKAVRITTWGNTANNGNAKTIKLYFGATNFATALTISQVTDWDVNGLVSYITNTTQAGFGQLLEGSDANANPGFLTRAMNPTETLSGAVTIKVTGTGGATNDILCFGMLIEVLGA